MDNMELQYDEAVFRLYIISTVATDGTISYQNQIVPFSVQPGVPTAVNVPKSLVLDRPGVVEKKGVLIEARDTVIVYGLNHAPKTSDAFLAYPVSTFDTAYMTMCWPAVTLQPYKGDEPPSQFAVVGAYDSTDVTLYPRDYTWNYHKDTVIHVRLNRGETYVVKSSTFEKYDMTGSRIRSSKPVAVFSGHKRAIVPQPGYTFKNYDHLVEQMPPISRWDSAALITPQPSPLIGTPLGGGRNMYRVLAAYDATVVRIDGIAQIVLNAGEFWQDTLFTHHHITANLPVLAAQFENSTPIDGFSGVETIGDPFMVIAPPVEQYLPAYLFISMPFNAYDRHFITLTVPTNAAFSFILDGAPLPDSLTFISIGTSGYSYGILRVSEGTHAIRSTTNTPFGLMVYGYGQVDSYGYLGGMKLDRLLDRFDRTSPTVQTVSRNCHERMITVRDTGAIRSGFVQQGVELSASNGSIAGVTISPDSGVITVTVQTDDPTRDNDIRLTVRDRTGNRVEYQEVIHGTQAVASRLYGTRETTFSFYNGQMYCDTMTLRNPSADTVTLASVYFRENTLFSIAPLAGTVQLEPGESVPVTLCIDARDVSEARDTLVLVDTCGIRIEYPVVVQSRPARVQAVDACGSLLLVDGQPSGKRLAGVLSVQPNPAYGEATAWIVSDEGQLRLELVGADGQLAGKVIVPAGEGIREVGIKTRELASGAYLVRLVSGTHTIGHPLPLVVVR